MTKFNNRVFGAAIVKAVNSNYNADFTGQPRTLPDGTVYATDKAFKYTIRNYLKDMYPNERIFYFKTLNDNLNPRTLDETYQFHFGDFPKASVIKQEVIKNLLSCLDIRYFGATYAGKTNISIHGPVQINHGMNVWHENNIYSEQITSPFRNPKESDKEKAQTTIGRDTKLQEGHYLHHFSVNPANIEQPVEGTEELTEEDINKLKEAMRRGATYYDSTSKAGTENEFVIWVQLNENSKAVLPNFTSLIHINEQKQDDGKITIDLSAMQDKLAKHKNEIQFAEIYYNAAAIELINQPDFVYKYDL